MLDGSGREIDYLRISVTDRCNLRCVYCMPENGVPTLSHSDILSYEAMVRLCRVFASLGVSKIKLTGGEPLVRRSLPDLVRQLKEIDGIRSVTLTTNGILLQEQLPRLLDAGLDGVNISLDTLDRARFHAITRRDGLEEVLSGLNAALSADHLNVKLNCVPTEENREDWAALAALAKDSHLAVRFIELMPVGLGASLQYRGEDEVRHALEEAFGPLSPAAGPKGNGPCRYFQPEGFTGSVGFISALSHVFCSQCNRVRLTARGFLKTCLQYETGIDLRPLLDRDAGDEALSAAILSAVGDKPAHHRFGEGGIQPQHMNEIGG